MPRGGPVSIAVPDFPGEAAIPTSVSIHANAAAATTYSTIKPTIKNVHGRANEDRQAQENTATVTAGTRNKAA